MPHPDWLKPQLTRGLRFHPTYEPSKNSDHLPMSLCAIAGLGGTESDAGDFARAYVPKLHECLPAKPLADWRAGIGATGAYSALLGFFLDELAGRGRTEVVARYLPEFIGSVAQEAFHPIIRLGYALEFDSDAECAAALAYLVSSFVETPLDASHPIELEAAFQALQSQAPYAFSAQGFGESIQELIAATVYPTGRASIAECAKIALSVARGTRNFFALHMVTASHAVRVCANYIESETAEAALTGALLAAYRVVGTPSFVGRSPDLSVDWLEADHAYKYAYSCLAEWRCYGDARYLEELRGMRAVGLIPQWCAEQVLAARS